MTWKSFFLTLAHAAVGGFASGLALWKYGTPFREVLVIGGISAATSIASALAPSSIAPTSSPAPTNGSGAAGWKPKP